MATVKVIRLLGENKDRLCLIHDNTACFYEDTDVALASVYRKYLLAQRAEVFAKNTKWFPSSLVSEFIQTGTATEEEVFPEVECTDGELTEELWAEVTAQALAKYPDAAGVLS